MSQQASDNSPFFTTKAGTNVPNPHHHLARPRRPVDFMSPAGRHAYHEAMKVFNAGWRNGGEPTVPHCTEYLSRDELARFNEHEKATEIQNARYDKLRQKAWQQWLQAAEPKEGDEVDEAFSRAVDAEQDMMDMWAEEVGEWMIDYVEMWDAEEGRKARKEYMEAVQAESQGLGEDMRG